MKRSEINTILQDAKRFLAVNRFHLPPFAAWTPGAWQQRGEEVREIIDCGLGWDITGFASGDFARCSLLLFTLCNGRQSALQAGKGKVYAGKRLTLRCGIWVAGMRQPNLVLSKRMNVNFGSGRPVLLDVTEACAARGKRL